MMNTINLVKPWGYDTPIERIIKHFLKERYPHQTLRVRWNYSTPRETKTTNTYFIINDPKIKSWDGLKLSKQIRLKEPHALLILASTELDYTKFFRSHIGFFGVVDLENLTENEIEDYLADSMSYFVN